MLHRLTVMAFVVALLSAPVLAQVERASGPVQADDLTPYAGTYTIEASGVAKATYLEVMEGYLRSTGVAFTDAQRKEQFRAQYDRIESDATMTTVVNDENGHSWVVHAPAAAAEGRPHGLFVFISPGDRGSVPEQWRETLEKNALIWVGPNGAGNRTAPLWRRAVALESIDLATQRYEIDPDRVYVSGHSGGARVASSVAIIHPDRFMGGVYFAGMNWYEPTPPRGGRFLPPSIGKPPASHLPLARDRSRHAIVQGTDDTVATYVPSLWDVIKNSGFRTFEYLSVEGLGHGLPDAEWLDKGLAVLDKPLRDGTAK